MAPRERSERFAGSDFTYEDIAERSLDDFTYQPLPAEDIIENHKTFKILATPVAPDRSQYKFIYYWVAQDVPCILHAEMYDQDGRKVREMHASGLRKESGMWGARKTEMRSLLEGTKSVLTIDEIHLNTGLDARCSPRRRWRRTRSRTGAAQSSAPGAGQGAPRSSAPGAGTRCIPKLSTWRRDKVPPEASRICWKPSHKDALWVAASAATSERHRKPGFSPCRVQDSPPSWIYEINWGGLSHARRNWFILGDRNFGHFFIRS